MRDQSTGNQLTKDLSPRGPPTSSQRLAIPCGLLTATEYGSYSIQKGLTYPDESISIFLNKCESGDRRLDGFKRSTNSNMV